MITVLPPRDIPAHAEVQTRPPERPFDDAQHRQSLAMYLGLMAHGSNANCGFTPHCSPRQTGTHKMTQHCILPLPPFRGVSSVISPFSSVEPVLTASTGFFFDLYEK